MQFASWGGLWFALSLPAIILLYLLKRRYVDTEVSSHLLWQRVLREQEANRPWQRLQRQLLLWLQLLAAALFVLALMQPYWWGRSEAKPHIVFVLDASASMQANTGDRTRLEQAKQSILSYAKEEASNSAYTLLVMKGTPEVPLRQQTGLSELEAAVQAIGPFYGKTAYQETLSLASALTKDDPLAEVRVYTDGGWTETAAGVSFNVPVVFDQQSFSAQGSNISVQQFGVKSLDNGSTFQAVASIKNWGETNAEFETTLIADTKAVQVTPLTLAPGERRTVYYDRLAPAKVYQLSMDVQDSLIEDNTAFAFPEGGGRRLAAYVGEGNLFLEKALALSQVDVIKIQKGADGLYASPSGKLPDVVILDGVERSALNGETWKQLLDTKPIWSFEEASPSAAEGKTVATPYDITDHPVTQYLHFQDVHIYGVHESQNIAGDIAIVASDGLPLITAGTDKGVPHLGFAFSLQQSDLPLRLEFPVLVRQTVSWLTQQKGGTLGRAIAGESMEIALHADAAKAVWEPKSFSGGEQPAEQMNGVLSSIQTVPDKPGLYQFMESNAAGHVIQSRLLEVSMDNKESNINGKMEWNPEAGANGSANPAGTAQNNDGSEPLGGRHADTLVPWIALLLLGILAIEWEVYRRGHSV